MALVGEALRVGPDDPLRRFREAALWAGVLGFALCILGAVLAPQQFFRSYLIAYLYWLGIALGCLAILMIHHIAGGAWGAVIRRLLESASATLPLLAVLFVPIALGLGELYEWARPQEVAHDPTLLAKSLYLNRSFFLVRAVVYLGSWVVLAFLLNRWSSEEDRSADPRTAKRLEYLSRGGLVLYGLTVSFAAIDWMMSLEPHWFSTIYGLLVMGGQGVAAFAFVIPLVARLARHGPLSRIVGADQLHDLGNLTLAFVMIWAYLSFSQLLIIWSANLPEEIAWYLHRSQGGWRQVGYALLVCNFALPFAVLLSRDLKRSTTLLAAVALWLVVFRFLDVYWLVAPAFERSVTLHWLDACALLGIGGLWMWFFLGRLFERPLVALNDASLPEGEA